MTWGLDLPPRLRTVVRRLRNRWLAAKAAREVAASPGYSFTSDYVSGVASLWIKHLAPLAGKPDVRLLEIGSFEGRSTIWMLENVLTHPTSSITCIDPFGHGGIELRFDHNLRVGGFTGRVRKLKGFSEKLLPTLAGEEFDAVYVDGHHSAFHVLMDAVASWRLLRPGGILIFDDYEWKPDWPPEARPQPAIDFFLRVHAAELELLHRGYQVIVRKR